MGNRGKNRIKEEIDSQGRKVNWLYEELSIKKSTFYRYLNNSSQPSNSDLKRIAGLLKVTMEDLTI